MSKVAPLRKQSIAKIIEKEEKRIETDSQITAVGNLSFAEQL